jgi:hypothetical protein
MAKQDKQDNKTTIRPNTEKYQAGRSSSGAKTQHNGDPVATALDGATVDEAVKLVSEALGGTQKEWKDKYAHLNVGQQRMNLGNRLRGVMNKMNKENEGSGDNYIAELASGVREAVEKRREKAVAEKEKAAATKAKEKEKAAA